MEARQHRHGWPKGEEQAIDRIFFGEPPSPEEWSRAVGTATTCVARFMGSPLAQRIRGMAHKKVSAPQKGYEADFDGVLLNGKPDLLFTESGVPTIVDFKTGQLSPTSNDKAWQQLNWYGMILARSRNVDLDRVMVTPMFLGAADWIDPQPLDGARVQALLQRAQRVDREVREKLESAEQATQPPEPQFALTKDVGQCVGCAFRACPGYARVGRVERGGLVPRWL